MMFTSSPPLRPMVDRPQLSCLRMNGGPFRVLEAVGVGFRQNGRAAEPRGCLFGNRPVAVDAYDAAGEVAADVGIVREIVVDAVQIGVVETEPIGARYEQRPVTSHDDAALDALGQNVDVLELPVVCSSTARARHALDP